MFTIRVLVFITRSVSIFPFLLSFCLQCCLLISTLAFRSPRSIILCVFCSRFICVVSSWNCCSASLVFTDSCFPYITHMAICVLPFIVIHLCSELLVELGSCSSVMFVISFLIWNPTPPPFSFLFFPYHWYPLMMVIRLWSLRCVSVIAAMCVPCVCRADVRLSVLLFRPRVFMVRILSFLIVCVVLLRFPLCVLGFCVFPFRVLVRCSGCAVLLGSWCWGSVVLVCIGVFVVIGDLFWVSLIVGFLRCCIWVFVVLGFLWWSPCSSQKVTRFLILGLTLLLPFVSLFVSSWVGVSWYCGFLSSYWVFVLGFLLGFCFWVGGVCHFRWPCRYLPTSSEMLAIMVFSVLAFFLSGRCGLVSLLGDRTREFWGRSRF